MKYFQIYHSTLFFDASLCITTNKEVTNSSKELWTNNARKFCVRCSYTSGYIRKEGILHFYSLLRFHIGGGIQILFSFFPQLFQRLMYFFGIRILFKNSNARDAKGDTKIICLHSINIFRKNRKIFILILVYFYIYFSLHTPSTSEMLTIASIFSTKRQVPPTRIK